MLLDITLKIVKPVLKPHKYLCFQ